MEMIMRKIIACLLITCSSTLFGQIAFSPEEKAVISQVEQIMEKSQEAVWPSLNMAETPIVLIFPDQRIVSFHLEPAMHSDWEKINPQKPHILATDKDKWGISKAMLHPAFPIEGKRAFVFNLSQNDAENPIAIMAHEWFHRYQMDKFRPEANGARKYWDQLNLNNLVLMRLEELILVKFMQAKSSLEKTDILYDFAIVNKIRQNLIQPESWYWEMHQQKMEGLADFISIRMFHRENELLLSLESKNDDELIEKAIKWRHYDIGASLGIALDFLEIPNWKKQVENGAFQAEILQQALLKYEDLLTRFELIKCRYPFTQIQNTISSHLENFNNEIGHWMSVYDDTPGCIVKLTPPRRTGVSGGGGSAHIFTLGDGTIISIKDHARSMASDNRWQLETHFIPVFFQNREGFREFKIDETAKIRLDGVEHNLKEMMAKGGEFSFKEIQLQSNQAHFQSTEHRGVLSAAKGMITIRYV